MSSPKAVSVLKRELRKKIRKALESMPSVKVKEESEAISALLRKDPKYLSAKAVALYSSMHNEFKTNTLLADAFEQKKRVFMPRVVDKGRHEMKMLECFSMAEIKTWEQSSWGIREPPLDGRAEAPKDVQLDVLIIPGVAFTMSGSRCGQGMGFYDTFLANYQHETGKVPHLIAPALSPQIVSDIPMSEHDMRVHRVISVTADA